MATNEISNTPAPANPVITNNDEDPERQFTNTLNRTQRNGKQKRFQRPEPKHDGERRERRRERRDNYSQTNQEGDRPRRRRHRTTGASGSDGQPGVRNRPVLARVNQQLASGRDDAVDRHDIEDLAEEQGETNALQQVPEEVLNDPVAVTTALRNADINDDGTVNLRQVFAELMRFSRDLAWISRYYQIASTHDRDIRTEYTTETIKTNPKPAPNPATTADDIGETEMGSIPKSE